MSIDDGYQDVSPTCPRCTDGKVVAITLAFHSIRWESGFGWIFTLVEETGDTWSLHCEDCGWRYGDPNRPTFTTNKEMQKALGTPDNLRSAPAIGGVEDRAW